MIGNNSVSYNPETEIQDLWKLATHHNPELLLRYLLYVAAEEPAETLSKMQRSPVGFDSFPAAIEYDSDGTVKRAMRVNFYTNRGTDPHLTETFHAHAQDAVATLYGPRGAYQVIERVRRLPDNYEVPPGVTVLRGMTSYINQLVDNGPGTRPEYHIRRLSQPGQALLQLMSISDMPSGGTTHFNGPEVHRVSVRYSAEDQVFVSVHLKGSTEHPLLSEYYGLTNIKGALTHEAILIGNMRASMRAENPARVLGPATMIYGDAAYDPNSLHDLPLKTSPEKAQQLLESAIAMLQS